MVAGFADVEDGVEGGGLAGGGEDGGDAALELGDLFRDALVGRVLKAGVEEAGVLQIKQAAIWSLVSYRKVVD